MSNNHQQYLDMNNSADYRRYLAMCNSEEYQMLQKFYHKKTLFDVLGVARQENPHSNFLSWLLNPYDTHGMSDFPLKRFLESVCLAFSEYGVAYLTENNKSFLGYTEEKKKNAREKLLLFCEGAEQDARAHLIRKLKQGDYHVLSCQVAREKVLDNQRRADIYIDLMIETTRGSRVSPHHLLIFIENKVRSGENDQQTDAYMDFILTKKASQFDFILPIFLLPIEDSELSSNAIKMADENVLEKNLPCVNRLFLLFNYQHLMDGVLSPCRIAFRGEKIYDTLTDYISCLGKSIDDSLNVPDETPAAVMAVSAEEKEWSSSLWRNHRRVLETAGSELRGEAEEPFIVRNASDTQFYRTVLSSVVSCSDELDIDGEKLGLLRNTIRVNQKSGYFVRQRDGSVWNFISGKRGKEALGALAYALLKQYILNHPNEKSEAIRERLIEQIHNSWLGEILITKDRLQELTGSWLDCYLKGSSPVCPWDSQINNSWAGCPFYELKKAISKGQDSTLLHRQGCPLSSKSNKELYDWYFGKKSAVSPCLYYVVSDFYIKGLSAQLQQQAWSKNGSNASAIFEETAFQNGGYSDAFGAISVGSDDFVYVARWWGIPAVEKLIDALEMSDYVDKEQSGIHTNLDFMIEDL